VRPEAFLPFGVSTVYEAQGRTGLIDTELIQIVPGSRVCGPARTVQCAQDDNLMVHAAMGVARPGEVLVVTMPREAPVGLVGDLLATQAQSLGVAAMLLGSAVRDVDTLREMNFPVWSCFVRSKGAKRETQGTLNTPVTFGGATICTGDYLLLDTDGAVVIPRERLQAVLDASVAREQKEATNRAKFQAGVLSIDLYGLRDSLAAHLKPAGEG